ncbi:unnamed protein product [Prunus armeniaca]
MNLIQESVLRQEVTTQRSKDTLNNMTAMMQWQVNRQFKKDREAAIARIPNPDAVVQQLDLPYGPPPGLAWPYQENPLIAQIAGMPERGEVQAGQRGEALLVQEREAQARPEGPTLDQPLTLLPEPPAVLPYRPRRMDPNPFPPPARGRRGGRVITFLPTMTGTGWGQTGGIIQIWKNRKNTGRKFCPCHTERSLGLIMPSQNKGEITTMSML